VGPRRVTLGDVAREAGVSSTTVSYVINGRGPQMRIAPETEAKVRQAIDELGFRPSHLARNLRTKQTKTIGVIADQVASGGYSSKLLLGASTMAAEHGYLLMIAEGGADDADSLAWLVEEFHDRHVDFTLVATVVTRELGLPEGLDPARTVFLNCVDPVGSVPAVLPDEYGAGVLAAETILGAGIRSEVWVVGDHTTESALAGPLRVGGLTDRLAREGVRPPGVVPCPWDVRAARETVCRWLETKPSVRCIVALNDRIAFGVYQALWDAGRRVPGDVSVISFDGSDLASWLRPTLTSVQIPYEEMGAAAVRVLLDPTHAVGEVHLIPMQLQGGHSVS
jgi:LacI family transcriptional regulator